MMEPAEERIPCVGEPAPRFTLPAVDGNALALEALRGRWVALFTWGSW
jgi:peroxiredoxin